MELRDEEYYEMIYTFRSAMCTLDGLSDRILMSENLEDEKKYVKELKDKISEYAEKLEKFSPEGDVANINYKDNILMENTRALLIDDNEISNYLMVKMLECLGVSVDVAESGKEGIKACQENEYDIIFVDYIMPDMNGVETIEKIRENEKGKKNLVIGITASVKPDFKEGLNKTGTELILFKPVKKQQLAYILYQELPNKIRSALQLDNNKV